MSQDIDGLMYTPLTGAPANWLIESMRRVGLDPSALPEPKGHGTQHLPQEVIPWKNVWSAGQGIGQIHDIPTVAELVRRLRREYVAACGVPNMARVAALDD